MRPAPPNGVELWDLMRRGAAKPHRTQRPRARANAVLCSVAPPPRPGTPMQALVAGRGLALPIIGRLLGHTQTDQLTARYVHLDNHPLRRASNSIAGRSLRRLTATAKILSCQYRVERTCSGSHRDGGMYALPEAARAALVCCAQADSLHSGTSRREKVQGKRAAANGAANRRRPAVP